MGRIVRQEGDRFVIRIIRSKRGWKKGDEEWDVATNMVLSPKPTREQREVGYL